MPAVQEAPSYSSTRVQRASRLNGIESTRLVQQLQCIERAKQHQCRLTNQDIRLVSLSLDYIQASSGNSPEAWRPLDETSDESGEADSKPEGPCFLYGERIISRKMRRVTRPMSAVERVMSELSDDCCSVISEAVTSSSTSSRPKSSPGKHIAHRPASVSGWARWRDNQGAEDIDVNVLSETRQQQPLAPQTTVTSAMTMADVDRFSTTSGSVFTQRPVPREAWEDDTSPATKKILQAQAVAQSGKRNTLYASPGDVMTTQASRNVRNLARKIRVASNPVMERDMVLTRSASNHHHRPASRQTTTSSSTTPAATTVSATATSADTVDRPPQRSAGAGTDALGRRATLGEILNQHKPTLSAGAWRQHLKQTAVNPMSVTTQRQAMLDAKKQINESQRAEVEQKVNSFIRGQGTSRWRRKSMFR